MRLIETILARLAGRVRDLLAASFVAPCVGDGVVRARVDGMVHEFRIEPGDFEGWAVVRPVDATRARVVEPAEPAAIAAFLQPLKRVRVRLARRVGRGCWVAHPIDDAEARQRLVRSHLVHLVARAARFDVVVARWDGHALWYEDADRRLDPADAQRLWEALGRDAAPEDLAWSGLTPEMRATYALARPRAERSDETRLREALRRGGGQLVSFREEDGFWAVDWTTANGAHHTSLVDKSDFTVARAGLCLSGHDRDFDLLSLVGVVEGAWD